MVVIKDPESDGAVPIEETEFFQEIADDVLGTRQGGAIIFVDAENARKGVAKTTAAIVIARLFANAFDYDMVEEDVLLAGPEYVRRHREQPGKDQPSVIVADELVGGGAGDARRAMSAANIKMGRAFQLLRKKRVITVTTLPDWGDADTRLQKQAAYRVHALEKPIGTFKAYKITVPFGGGEPRTKGLGPGDVTRRINFPDLKSHGDPFFDRLEELKDELIEQADFDASALQEPEEGDEADEQSEKTIRREERVETAIRLYRPWEEDSHDMTYAEIADAIPEYGSDWVGKVVRQWQRGQHRDLVPDPT